MLATSIVFCSLADRSGSPHGWSRVITGGGPGHLENLAAERVPHGGPAISICTCPSLQRRSSLLKNLSFITSWRSGRSRSKDSTQISTSHKAACCCHWSCKSPSRLSPENKWIPTTIFLEIGGGRKALPLDVKVVEVVLLEVLVVFVGLANEF